jgi:N6-adenosine-specific RNA methylase IME4
MCQDLWPEARLWEAEWTPPWEHRENTSPVWAALRALTDWECAVEECAVESSIPTRYRTLLLDPPWPVEAGRRQVDQRCERFGKVSVSDLENLPLEDLADDQTHLYVWVPNVAKLEDAALRIMERAGFHYKSRIVWVKIGKKSGAPSASLGHYFRPATEYLLFGVKNGLPAGSHSLTNVLLAPRRGLAVKPEESYRLIEAMSPEPRLELFARRRMPGWHVWGDEVDCDVEIDWSAERLEARGGTYEGTHSLWK